MSDKPSEDRIDVRFLRRDDLPQDQFPGGQGEVFRVFFTPEVHSAIWKHGSENTSVEICGVLVGIWQRDANGPFVRITESIRGEAAQSKFAEVTFTHETWAKINAQMDSKFLGLSIVGWYHTHPDFGVFLSDRDTFIQEHFFSGPGQVAHVVDPIRKTEGVFVWREGKPTLTEHFWVGNRILVGTAANAEGRAPASGMATGAPPAAKPQERSSDTSSLFPPASRMLIYLCFFLIGYMLSGLRSQWDRQMIEEGAFSRLVMFKGLRLGLGGHLEQLQGDLAEISRQTDKLQADLAKAGRRPEESPPSASLRPLRTALADAATRIDQIRERYGYTREEEALLLGIARSRAHSLDREKLPSTEPSSTETSSSRALDDTRKRPESTNSTESPKEK